LIDGHPRREPAAQVPHVERQTGDLFGRLDVAKAAEDADTAKIELARQDAHLDGHIGPGKAADEELPDAAAKGLWRHELSL
jgi:hypothetical protein